MSDITRVKLKLLNSNKMISSGRILAMIYGNLSTDANMLEVVTIRSLTDMQWESYGDDGARQFYSTWIDRTSRLDCRLDDEVLCDILLTEMKKSAVLKIPLISFKDRKKAEQNYEICLLFSRNIFRKFKRKKI